MTKLEVIRRDLRDLSLKLADITGRDGERVYTEEFRDRATRIAVKVHEAIEACSMDISEAAF